MNPLLNHSSHNPKLKRSTSHQWSASQTEILKEKVQHEMQTQFAKIKAVTETNSVVKIASVDMSYDCCPEICAHLQEMLQAVGKQYNVAFICDKAKTNASQYACEVRARKAC